MTENISGTNTLGRVSLALGILSAAMVFGIGICALTGLQGGWLGGVMATILFVCGASSAFLGLLGLFTGLGGILASNSSRMIAGIGIAISILGMCMFILFLSQFGG